MCQPTVYTWETGKLVRPEPALNNVAQFSFSQNIPQSHSDIQVICCNGGVGRANFIKSFLQNFLDIQLSFPACLCLRVQN